MTLQARSKEPSPSVSARLPVLRKRCLSLLLFSSTYSSLEALEPSRSLSWRADSQQPAYHALQKLLD